MNLFKKFLIISFVSIFYLSGSAQNNSLQYAEKITISNGLAHNGVTCLLEDSRGFIWFGTYEGLNRYDGYKLKTYKNTSNINLLSSNRIRTLSEDGKGNIWIGTDEGITIYNYQSERFQNIYSNNSVSGPIVRKVFFNDKLKKVFCITEEDGVLIFNANYTFLSKSYPKTEDNQQILFFDGVQLNSKELVLATSKGLLSYQLTKNVFKEILTEIKNARSIIKIDKNIFLVAKRKGVAIINYNTKEHLRFKILHNSLHNMQVNSMLVDNNKNLWLGLLNAGLVKLTKPNFEKSFDNLNIQRFKDNLQILRSSALMLSSQNHCWYATFNKGVFKFDLKENIFNYYSADLNTHLGLKSNMIASFSNFDEDRVLISETIGGVSILNTKTHKFEQLPFKLPKSDKKRERGVFVDSRKDIWVDFIEDNSIYRLAKNGKEYEKITLDNSEKNLQIKGYTEDSQGNIWITSLNDVYKVIIDTSKKVIRVEKLSDNLFFKGRKLKLVRYVYPDPFYDYVWIGSDSKGLYRVSTANNVGLKNSTVKQYLNSGKKNSIPSNFVTSVVRLPNKNLWIGTEGGGLCKVNNSNTNPEFISFTEQDGLSNNVIKNILYADTDNLWIATNIGLNKYNIKENKFRNFNVSDGLPFEDFWFSAGKLENGNFIFSGLDGLCFFKPTKISETENLPKLQFENFKIFNQLIATNDTINNRVLLPKNLNILEEITLNHNENIFSLDVASLHFSNTENHKIKYKLHPINDTYIETPSTQKTINYSALPPGEYEFIAQASNSLNQWTAPKKLKITITPSIWKTNFAYFMYFILLLAIILVVIKVILKIQSLHHKVEIEQIEIDKIRQINEAKLTFFSNISHEIKTPITLISDPLKTLISKLKGNKELESKLSLIQRQTKKILKLIDQVHDFRKADANALSINYTRFSFNSFIKNITQDFEQLAKSEHKNFNIETSKKVIIVSADKDKLEKIFDNLINNAFKYTEKEDSITLSYQYNEKDLIISISDTGSGISKEDLSHVFERFYQSKNNKDDYKGGSGIGLAFTKQLTEMHYGYIEALSEEGTGTEIRLKLPIVKEILENEVVKEIVLPNENEVAVNTFSDKSLALDSIKVSDEFSDSLIYYVEDDNEMRNYGTELLSGFFKVNSFSNGEECLQAMENKWPDLVVSDVQMPKMNGLELCIQIKSDLKTSHIPVILLTALTKIEDHLQGIRDGADAYIKKPFNTKHLITKIEALLVNRKQLRARYKVGIPLTKENNKNNRNDNAFLEKMYSLIEKNIDNQNFDLNTLSKELYLNRTHFYQKVKVLTDRTPLEILRMYRLKKAAYLLANEKLTVNEVFLMTGFKSRPHFSTIFAAEYGVSPGKYAKSLYKK